MNLGLAILLILVALAGGIVLGFYLARKQVENYIADKPILDENALRMMMSQMGQKPSEAKVQQVLRQIKSQQRVGKKK
ncbi:YneF family protein [Streptococcus sp. X16XC17]|uniref:YneF family protein n=1 Tax=unclassified Streptococcus TaxID=2608887 RepID=UPI00066FF3EB|nr:MULTISPECIES: YneF family protein [unclassified Streptococcus]TCD46043.1 YneF family protein [Streptococcus sp. X16XC17]